MIVGCGTGDKAYLTRQEMAALLGAEVWIGEEALVDRMEEEISDVREVAYLDDPEKIREFVDETSHDMIAVLLNGTPGFWNRLEEVYRVLSPYRPVLIPGISEVAYFASKAGISYDDACLVDLENPEASVLPAVRFHHKVIVRAAEHPEEVMKDLILAGEEKLFVCSGENLGKEDERLLHGSIDRMAEEVYAPGTIFFIFNRHPIRRSLTGIDDREFIRGAIPMTKSEVRAVVMSRMRLLEDDVVYDIGAGTGSVTCECALQVLKGRVYAIERKKEGIELIRQNAHHFGLHNVHPILGHAPEALASLPDPDAAFIGGSGGRMRDIIQLLHSRNPQVRIVATAVTIESAGEMTAALEELDMEPEILQIQASRAKKIGSRHMMMAENPIYIISAGGEPEAESVG